LQFEIPAVLFVISLMRSESISIKYQDYLNTTNTQLKNDSNAVLLKITQPGSLSIALNLPGWVIFLFISNIPKQKTARVGLIFSIIKRLFCLKKHPVGLIRRGAGC